MSESELIVILGSNSVLAKSVIRILKLQNKRFIAFNRCTDHELEKLLSELRHQSTLKSCTIFYFNSLHSKVDSVINFEEGELFDHLNLLVLRFRHIIKSILKCIPSDVVITLIGAGSLMEEEDRPLGVSYALAKIIHSHLIRLLAAYYKSKYLFLAISFKIPFFESEHHEYWPEILKTSLSKRVRLESDYIAHFMMLEISKLQNLGLSGYFERDIVG